MPRSIAVMPSLLAFVAALVATMLLCVTNARAHTIGISTGEYTAKGSSVVGKLAFARGEIATIVPSLDANHDGHITAVEVEGARPTLREKIAGRIRVTSNGRACEPTIIDAGLTELDGMLLSVRWDCEAQDKPFEVTFLVAEDLARGHRHIARTVSGESIHDQILTSDERTFSIAPDASSSSAGAEESKKNPEARAAPPPRRAGFWAFFKLGIEHILTGYDHLVFIVGLVLARATFRSLVTVVTAFTIAHSITLAIAVLGVWTPSSRIVEPAIALSIAYVGVENFFVKDATKRWRITFPFGLVHGFGFAGALREVALPTANIPVALVSFNLGVELGQIAVLALVLPAIFKLREKFAWFEPFGVKALSGLVALAGLVWFIARIV